MILEEVNELDAVIQGRYMNSLEILPNASAALSFSKFRGD